MSKLPETQQSLSRWLRQRERTALRQRQTSAFARSGTSVTAEGAQSLDGTLTVTPGSGFVSIDGSLGVHGTAAFDGSTTIGGDLVVAGTLSLPNSIVPNAALASPVMPGIVSSGAFNFALGITAAEIVGADLTVPDGFTRLLCNATAYMTVVPSANALGTLVVELGAASSGCSGYLTLGQVNTIPAGLATLAVGLTPGSTLHLSASAFAAAGQSASAYNIVTLNATLLWLR